MVWVDPVRWFETLGTCGCGKPATGILRGLQNESYGKYCGKCAKTRIKKAERARELAAKMEAHPNAQ